MVWLSDCLLLLFPRSLFPLSYPGLRWTVCLLLYLLVLVVSVTDLGQAGSGGLRGDRVPGQGDVPPPLLGRQEDCKYGSGGELVLVLVLVLELVEAGRGFL